MIRYIKQGIISFFFTTLIFFNGQALKAQASKLEIIGTAEKNMQPIPNAKVTLYKNGSAVNTVHTKEKGEFRFELETNNEYIIEIQKDGLLSKKIAVNTEIPSEITGRWTMEFAMTLFPGCEGVNTSALNDPVDRIKFSSNKSDFISDDVYVKLMKDRMGKLMQDIDICQSQKYRENMTAGDQLLKNGEFAAAMEKYQEALNVFPDDKAATRKMNEAVVSAGQNEQTQAKFSATITEADKLVADKNFEGARAKYNEALKLKPNDTYAKSKVTELNQLIAAQQQTTLEKQKTENSYNQLISQANIALNSKDYVTAKSLYQQALQIKPDASLPSQKITEIEPLIASQQQELAKKQATDKDYQDALALAENAFRTDDLENALQHFNRAAEIKPEQSYPRQKIVEINKILDGRRTANMQAEKAALRKRIESALDEGDQMLADKNYDGAEAAYQRALQLDPNDTYAKQQLNKVKSMQNTAAAEKQKALEKAYSASVTSGDKFLSAASYEQAVEAYKQALLQKPGDLSVQGKLADAEKMLAAEQQKKLGEQQKRKQFDQYLAEGNSLFESKQYDASKRAYQSALDLYPEQSHPKSRIVEIDNILAASQKQKQYAEFISRGDAFFNSKDYPGAKSAYGQALTISPADNYARQKISEIDAILLENERLATTRKLNDEQYNRTLQEADNLFNQTKYPEAKASYQKALTFKPGEAYPQQQITKIDAVIAENQRKEDERKNFEQQYTTIVKNADDLLASKNYLQAKIIYQQALGMKPNEVYPKQKITAIDEIMREQERNLADQKAKDDRYQAAVTEGDKLMGSQKYQEARLSYQTALGIKPAESYPQQQLTKIEGLVAEQARVESEARLKEQQFREALARGDQLFKSANYAEAKTSYQQALSYRPTDEYVIKQISLTEAQLARIEKEKQELAAFELKYRNFISSADKAYDNREYPLAKSNYNEALKLKPGEKYPQERLNKIAEFERILAVQEANKKVTTATTVANQPTSRSPQKIAELKFANDSERDKYLNELKKNYPAGVTLEVHKDKTFTMSRYIVIRGDEVREFRKTVFTWGGIEFSLNGIPISGDYLETQVKARDGEFFQKFEF